MECERDWYLRVGDERKRQAYARGDGGGVVNGAAAGGEGRV